MQINAFINGRFTNEEQAMVSVKDRAFLFGDGIYEVIRCYGGFPCQLDEHLQRLQRSAAYMQIALPYSAQEFTRLAGELLVNSGRPDSALYIQVTRGCSARRHQYSKGLRPTVYMLVMDVDTLPPGATARVTLVPDERWSRCYIKTTNLLYNVIARQEAADAGFDEAVFEHRLGITEGAVSNIFIARDGRLITAPKGERILSGITRDTVIALARGAGVGVEERYFNRAELLAADEVFLTNTTIEILPVVEVDGAPVGGDPSRPLTIRLQELYRQMVADFLRRCS